jgi:oligoribonuclease
MPNFINYLSYRIIDVSSIKELSKRWYPNTKHFFKKESHRALDDIDESIRELKYHREKIFK